VAPASTVTLAGTTLTDVDGVAVAPLPPGVRVRVGERLPSVRAVGLGERVSPIIIVGVIVGGMVRVSVGRIVEDGIIVDDAIAVAVIVGRIAVDVAVGIIVGVRVSVGRIVEDGIAVDVIVGRTVDVGVGGIVGGRVPVDRGVAGRVSVGRGGEVFVAVGSIRTVAVGGVVAVRVGDGCGFTVRKRGTDTDPGPGFTTVTRIVPVCVAAPVARRKVGETNVVVSGAAFHSTWAPSTKPLPCTSRLNGPTGIELGVTSPSSGAG
jgi:hypothetical protein